MLCRTLKSLFGIWAVLIFSIGLIVSVILYLIIFAFTDDKKGAHIAHRYVSRSWARFILIMYGIRVKVKNAEYLDSSKVYVFIANHRSMLDIPAYAVSCNHTFRFLAKVELMKIPLLGYVIRKLYISVDRKNKEARVKSMENMNRSIRDGISVFICPEGTRNKTDDLLLTFHDGAFRLAISAQVPLAVLTIINSRELLSPLRPLQLKPGTLECIWAMPIETKGMKEDDIPLLKQKVIEIMEGELKRS
jgi:1-acyl-sn-glycerol-3-phosphate acyltransferase